MKVCIPINFLKDYLSIVRLIRAQTFIIYFTIKINEIKENIDLTLESKEVEAYTWVHKNDLKDILFNKKENLEIEAYSLSKKNMFEKNKFSSFNLANYNQGEGEGMPFGHYTAFKYLLAKSNF